MSTELVKPTYINQDFLDDCKSSTTLRVFKVVASYFDKVDPTHEEITTAYQGLFSYESGTRFLNPWFYCPVHIEDDIITVKLTGDLIANYASLWFIYNEGTDVEGDDSTTNKLAFYTLVNTQTRLLELEKENYISFSFKKLFGIKCNWDTFDRYLDKPVPNGQTEPDYNIWPAPNELNNVYRLDLVEHKHSNEAHLASMNDAFNVLQSKYYSNGDPLVFDISTEPLDVRVSDTILRTDGSHNVCTSSDRSVTHDIDWIKIQGISNLFYQDTTIANQEDFRFLDCGEY